MVRGVSHLKGSVHFPRTPGGAKQEAGAAAPLRRGSFWPRSRGDTADGGVCTDAEGDASRYQRQNNIVDGATGQLEYTLEYTAAGSSPHVLGAQHGPPGSGLL